MKEFASRIRADRAITRHNQEEYAEGLGLHRNTIQLWESDGPGLSTVSVSLAEQIATDDAQFRRFVLEMAGLKEETPASPEG